MTKTIGGGMATAIMIQAVVVAQVVGGVVGKLLGVGAGGIAGGLALLAVVSAWLRKEDAVEQLGLRSARSRDLAAAALLGASVLTLNILVNAALPFRPDTARLEAALAAPPMVLVFVMSVIVAPVSEELLFRGMVLPALRLRLGPKAAVVISALMFALVHISLPQLIPAFLSGLALGALAIRTRSIVPGIVAHAINNAVVFLLMRPETHLADLVEAHVAASLAVGIAILVGGLALLRGATRPPLAIA